MMFLFSSSIFIFLFIAFSLAWNPNCLGPEFFLCLALRLQHRHGKRNGGD